MKDILCTLGPSTLNERSIKRLTDAQVTLFRLNLSHIDFENLENHIKLIRAHSNVDICIDTEGAQLRTSKITNGFIVVEENQIIEITENNQETGPYCLSLNPASGMHLLELNDLVSIDFNSVLAQVIGKDEKKITLKILNGGKIGQNKAITVDREISLSPLTEKDLKCLKLSKNLGITHFALSFAGHENDVQFIRSLIAPSDTLISKVESLKGLKNLEGIINSSDAILIDRGDLSREVKIYKIPAAQKYIIGKCKAQNKKVYVATNLLESMITCPTPTRAEVNDVYNTLRDGVDGLVLAAETAIGKFPMMCVNMIKDLIKEYEINIKLETVQESALVAHFFGEQSTDRGDNNLGIKRAIHVSDEVLLDCNLITNGTFHPLTGFMDEKNISSVLDNFKLVDGTSWSLPILLPLENDNFKTGEVIVLCDRSGNECFQLKINSVFSMDMDRFILKFFNTNSDSHPGVKKYKKLSSFFVSGDVVALEGAKKLSSEWVLSPKKLKEIFEFKGWKKIVGFHTRNIPHRGHEYIQNYALEITQADGLLISPIIGKSRSGDFSSETVMSCYKNLIASDSYPSGRVMLAGFASYPRFAGPREALFTAICRKNMGCTHFIIGRDHSGVGDFYTEEDMDFCLDKMGQLGIEIVKLGAVGLNKSNKSIVFKDQILADDYLPISGTLVREKLNNDQDELNWLLSGPVIKSIRELADNNSEIFKS